MAVKKTKRRKKTTGRAARQRSDKEVTAGGAGTANGQDTVPYPTAGENPAFQQWLDDELQGSQADSGQAETGKRPPGRPPGTGKNQRAAKALNEYQAAGLDETIMAAVWKGVFQAAALGLQSDAMLLTDTEALALARPSCVLWGYYMPAAISPTQAAWSQLGMVLFGVIGIRADAIRQGVKRRQAKPPEPAAPGIPAAGDAKPDIPTTKVHFKPAKPTGADGSA